MLLVLSSVVVRWQADNTGSVIRLRIALNTDERCLVTWRQKSNQIDTRYTCGNRMMYRQQPQC